MKQGEILHGFRLRYTQDIPEIGAKLHRMAYEKNGADLVWLERPDDNKTFSIAFKTIPEDDTGVFHILEHSVLCGSRKYPVKEPFVELLKSSLQTFLNAFTFPDKTMYPVCSRNDRDFLNLIDVYMDAVLHPLSVENPAAFRQEGWHYELDSGELRYNGVVYNEMKGAYAAPDTVLQGRMNRLLFPDNCYGFESGGQPEHIPELDYKRYLASHARFYHPSNARIFLDGSVDLDAVLAKLDGFLREYDALEMHTEIPMQHPVRPEEDCCFYEVDEQAENKVLLAQGWVYGTFDEPLKKLTCGILSEVLCGSNEAPLKKALLERGLAEDVEFQSQDGIQQQYAVLVVRNTSQEKRAQVWQVIDQTLKDLVRRGVDSKQLHAVINHLEFVSREMDYGNLPRGLVYAMSSLESWLYDGDPAQNLCCTRMFQTLREKASEGWFESFIQTYLLDNPHQARLCLLPSSDLGEQKLREERGRLEAARASWSKADTEAVIEQFQSLRFAQQTPDTPQALATIPVLSVADVPEEVTRIPQTIHTVDGVTCLHQPVETDGIVYLDLYFSAADVPQEQLYLLSVLAKLLGQTATEHYGVMDLRSEIDGNLGHFGAASTVFAGQAAVPYLTVSVSALERKKDDVIRLVSEVLNGSLFEDGQYIYNLLRQLQIGLEQSVAMSGSSYAAARAQAGFSAAGAVSEALSGLEFLRRLQAVNRDFRFPALREKLRALGKTLFSRERLTLSVTGNWDSVWISGLLHTLPSSPMGTPVCYQAAPVRREGILIPAEVGFAAKAANLHALDQSYSGAGLVAAQLLTFGYLWNTIRVKGGAYGTDLSLQSTGDISLTSYRDPSPAQSLAAFDGAGEALRAFCTGQERLDKYIISTIAATDPLLSPRMKGMYAAICYFTGRTHASRQKLRREILHTTREDLERFSRTLDALTGCAGVCVIGGKAGLEDCGSLLDSVVSLQAKADSGRNESIGD